MAKEDIKEKIKKRLAKKEDDEPVEAKVETEEVPKPQEEEKEPQNEPELTKEEYTKAIQEEMELLNNDGYYRLKLLNVLEKINANLELLQ